MEELSVAASRCTARDGGGVVVAFPSMRGQFTLLAVRGASPQSPSMLRGWTASRDDLCTAESSVRGESLAMLGVDGMRGKGGTGGSGSSLRSGMIGLGAA